MSFLEEKARVDFRSRYCFYKNNTHTAIQTISALQIATHSLTCTTASYTHAFGRSAFVAKQRFGTCDHVQHIPRVCDFGQEGYRPSDTELDGFVRVACAYQRNQNRKHFILPRSVIEFFRALEWCGDFTHRSGVAPQTYSGCFASTLISFGDIRTASDQRAYINPQCQHFSPTLVSTLQT